MTSSTAALDGRRALLFIALAACACGPSQADWEQLIRENERLRLQCSATPQDPSVPHPRDTPPPPRAVAPEPEPPLPFMTPMTGLPPPRPRATAPARPVALNTAVTMSNFRVTVTGVKECNQDFAAEGSVALGVEVLVENISDQTWQVEYAGTIRDAAGYEHPSRIIMNACQPDLDPTSSVRPGEKLRGYLWTFVLPRAAKGLVLTYRLPLPRFDFEEVRFDLGR